MGPKVDRDIEICDIVESIPFPYVQMTLSEWYSLPGLQYSHLWIEKCWIRFSHSIYICNAYEALFWVLGINQKQEKSLSSWSLHSSGGKRQWTSKRVQNDNVR